MKKRKIALRATTLLLAAGLLVGCGSEEEGSAEKSVSKVNFSGISATFKSTDTIDWSKFQVTVKYSDDSAITITSDKMEFDVTTPEKSETEALVKTDGLYALEGGSLVEKRYYVSVALKGDFTKFYDAGSIAVGDVIREKYDLMEYAAPRFMSSLESVRQNAGTADEGAFKQYNDDFTVGTLNPWEFEPVATFSEKGKPSEMDDLTNYEKDVKLYVVEGNKETEVSQEAYNRILLKDGKYQFATEDAGKRFKIVVSPKDFQKDFLGNDVTPISFSFNVEEGMNIYEAKQLGVLNLTNLQANEFIGDNAFCEHLYDTGSYRDGNGQASIFLVNPENKDPYDCLDLPRLWENFLINNGVLTAENVAKFRDVKGVFFQKDIKIETTDIPAEYFITDNDPVNASFGCINTGALRDECSIYAPTTLNKLTISGNYFKLDSSALPLCRNTTDGSVCDALGGFDIVSFPPQWDYPIPPGHANLFVICGPCQGKQEWRENQTYASTANPATIKNMLTVGNTGKEISGAESDLDKKMKVTGLIFAKSSYAPATMDNLIIQEYMIGLFGDHGLGQKTLTREQKSYTFIKNSKVFDCSNSGIFNYHDGGMEVNNTVMKRFGGACLISAGIDGTAQNDYNNQPNTIFTPDCEFENYVSGGEVYYAAVNATDQIGAIKGFDAFFNEQLGAQRHLVGPEGDEHAGKMNVIALQMDGDGYVSAANGRYSGLILMNKGGENELKVELDDSVTTSANTAKCKTELGETFVLDPADQMSSAMGASGVTGGLLDMDLCLGNTYLSIVFSLF